MNTAASQTDTIKNHTEPPVFFWKSVEENGWCSNWYPSPFVIDDFEYLFVEQYIWGIKLDKETAAVTDPADWPGQNLIGRILMDLREEFREEWEKR